MTYESDKYEKANEVIAAMLSPQSIAAMKQPPVEGRFGSEFPQLAFEHAYADLWTRPGLSLKERSLVTIGILIGLCNERELRSHFAAGLRNGLTPKQLEEIVYHATAYAGFPAASTALAAAAEVLASEKMKEDDKP